VRRLGAWEVPGSGVSGATGARSTGEVHGRRTYHAIGPGWAAGKNVRRMGPIGGPPRSAKGLRQGGERYGRGGWTREPSVRGCVSAHGGADGVDGGAASSTVRTFGFGLPLPS